MSKTNNHIVQKQHLSIAFENVEAGMGIQDNIAIAFKEQLQPRMEKLFDELADEGHRIKLEHLEIDCGVLPENNWEQDWIETTIEKLKAVLITANKTRIEKDVLWKDFFYFLKRGLLPWNSNVAGLKDFEAEIKFDDVFFVELEEAMLDQHMVVRLLNQFSDKFTTALVKSLLSRYEKKMKRLNAFRPVIHQSIIIREQKEAILKAFVNELQSRSIERGDKMKIRKTDFNTSKEIDDVREVYVNNAGLVLLHPFLPKLFENLKLMDKQQWVSEEAQHIALAVTCFLATGETQLPEFDLPLNKIICGLPVSAVLQQAMPVSLEQEQACDELLEQVIKMWSSLKNTGISAFRETLLQRSGKLTRRDNGYMLQVEPKAYDVLLSSLPWGIGVIKLPWMKEIVYTEWM